MIIVNGKGKQFRENTKPLFYRCRCRNYTETVEYAKYPFEILSLGTFLVLWPFDIIQSGSKEINQAIDIPVLFEWQTITRYFQKLN